MQPVTTPRLELRPLTIGDVTDRYIRALQDPEVIRWTGARHVRWDREEILNYVQRTTVDGVSVLLGVFLMPSRKHIGNVRLFNFHQVDRRVELALMIFDKSEWGHGYGTEAAMAASDYAFHTLGFHRVHADYYATNRASARLFAKAGFRIEGVFKDHFRVHGAYVDSIRVAKLAPAARGASDQIGTTNGSVASRRMLPSAGPSITETEVHRVTEAARHGWYADMRGSIEEFEARFAAYTGMRYALATSNCTSALHLAMLALRIGAEDEVIVPDITWVASAAPICYVGATPVFADIDRESWCLAPAALERCLTKRTKAVVVVGLYGNLPDMDALRAIVHRRRVTIIEDAAESLGATYKGRKAGTFGDIGVFSFNGTKIMVTGEGGMFATNTKTLYERARRLSHHGMITTRRAKRFWSYELGYKYQMSNLQAALGLAQLSRLDELVEHRRRLFHWYQERLTGLEGLQLNHEAAGVKSTFWVVTLIVPPAYRMRKEALMQALERSGIASRPFFYPLSSMPPFAGFCRGKKMPLINPVAYALSPYGISLPSAACLTESDVDYVCECLTAILTRKRRVSKDGGLQLLATAGVETGVSSVMET